MKDYGFSLVFIAQSVKVGNSEYKLNLSRQEQDRISIYISSKKAKLAKHDDMTTTALGLLQAELQRVGGSFAKKRTENVRGGVVFSCQTTKDNNIQPLLWWAELFSVALHHTDTITMHNIFSLDYNASFFYQIIAQRSAICRQQKMTLTYIK